METFGPNEYIMCFFPSFLSVTLLTPYQLFPNLYVSFSFFVRFCLPLAFNSSFFNFLVIVTHYFYSISSSSIVICAYFVLQKQLKYGGSN